MASIPRQAAWICAAACLLGTLLPGQAGVLRLPRPGMEGRAPKKGASIHTVITTECTPYFDWQSLGLLYSFKRSGQPGKLTRLLSCTDEQLQSYRGLDLMPTHVVPSLTRDPNPEHNDHYSAYNKPGAVLYWLRDVEPEEDYILVIDADMIMRAPFIPERLGVRPGWAISAYFGYLKGVSNELALRHVPHVLPRNDTKAGPVGRRGDQVGGFCMMYKEDLKHVAPLWLQYSKDVRHDPDAWNLTGDAYTHNPGDKPWIAEMYGYSFGTASADVWHNVDFEAMLYPSYLTYVPPKVLHYGLHWEVGNTKYFFDKHWYFNFDVLQCPPWNLTAEVPSGGLFRHPPHPATYPGLHPDGVQGFDLLSVLLAAEPVIVLNAAFCQLHRARCPPSEQLLRECAYAELLERDFDEMTRALQANLTSAACINKDERCPAWAADGECTKNIAWMQTNCRKACRVCVEAPPAAEEAGGMVAEGVRELGLLLGLRGGGSSNRTWGWESLWRQQHARAQELQRLAAAAGHYAAGGQAGGGSRQGQQLLLGRGRRGSGEGGSTDVVLSFFHRLGWLGILLWSGTALLFLTLLPTRRLRRQVLRGSSAASPVRGSSGGGSAQKPRYLW